MYSAPTEWHTTKAAAVPMGATAVFIVGED